MPFPTLAPTSRTFEAGDYPVKRFMSQNGAETRILYGSRRTGQRMSLTYQNIFDHQAEEFIEHYDEVFGTLNSFSIASEKASDAAKTGWNGYDVPDPVTTSFPAGSGYSAGKWYVKTTPETLVEGSPLKVEYGGIPNRQVTLRYRTTTSGLEMSDFSSSFAETIGAPGTPATSFPHDSSHTFFADGRPGFYDLREEVVLKDAKLENLEVLVIEMLDTDAATTLLASVHVRIVDSKFSVNSQPVAKARTIGVGDYSDGWRYEGPPQLTQVRPGVSTVTVNLIGILGAP